MLPLNLLIVSIKGLILCVLKYILMRKLQINIPDSVDKNDNELTMIIAAKLYEDGLLTSGQAADLAGLTKRAFIEMLGKYGVSVFSSSVNELDSDIANA
jgi:predicted HTH domain antitoxin